MEYEVGNLTFVLVFACFIVDEQCLLLVSRSPTHVSLSLSLFIEYNGEIRAQKNGWIMSNTKDKPKRTVNVKPHVKCQTKEKVKEKIRQQASLEDKETKTEGVTQPLRRQNPSSWANQGTQVARTDGPEKAQMMEHEPQQAQLPEKRREHKDERR